MVGSLLADDRYGSVAQHSGGGMDTVGTSDQVLHLNLSIPRIEPAGHC